MLHNKLRRGILSLMIGAVGFISPLAAQDDVDGAIALLLEASVQIAAMPNLNPHKTIHNTVEKIHERIRAEAEFQFCHALVRMRHNITGFSLLTRLVSEFPEHNEMKKAHIYAAFKEKGAKVGCAWINTHFHKVVFVEDEESEKFQIWLMILVEGIKDNEKIGQLVARLIRSTPYRALKDKHWAAVQQEIAKVKADQNALNLKNSQQLDKQITEAKNLLTQKEKMFENSWEKAHQRRIAIWQQMGTSWMLYYLRVIEIGAPDPVVSIRQFNVYLDPYWGVQQTNEQNLFLRGSVPKTFVKSYQTGKIYLLANNGAGLENFVLDIQHRRLQLNQIKELTNGLNQLTLQMTRFLVDFSSKYKDAIANDAELTLAVISYRQRIAFFNQIVNKSMILEKKVRDAEAKNLTELGAKLLHAIDFSIEDSLARFQNQ